MRLALELELSEMTTSERAQATRVFFCIEQSKSQRGAVIGGLELFSRKAVRESPRKQGSITGQVGPAGRSNHLGLQRGQLQMRAGIVSASETLVSADREWHGGAGYCPCFL